MLDLFYLVILLPFIGFLINGLLYRKMPHTLAAVLGILAVAIPFFITSILIEQLWISYIRGTLPV